MAANTLNAEKAADIRSRFSAGEKGKDLAVEYGVSGSTISYVVRGHTHNGKPRGRDKRTTGNPATFICFTCDVEKDRSDFYPKPIRRGHASTCKACTLARMATHNGSATRKLVARRSLVKQYGLTLDQYDEMLAAQSELCAICRRRSQNGKPLSIDHCHMSNRVRGLLCQDCNMALGMFKDSPTLLMTAIEYLTQEAK